MGAFLGALIGRHMAHTEDARQQTRDWILAPIIDRRNNPTSPHYTNEQFDKAIKAGFQMGYLDKHQKPILDAGFDEMKQVWQEAQDKRVKEQALAQVQSNQPQDRGRPLMNASATPPVAPVGVQSQIASGLNSTLAPPQQQFQFSGPQQLPPPPSAQGGDAQQQAKSAMLRQLLPALLKAQQGGGMQNMMQGAPAGGVPQQGTPPFSSGTMAAGASGPMQQGENPKMAQAAVQGGEGYGTPPPAATPPKSSMPKPPYYADTFGGGGMDPEEYAAREGRTTALKARPTLEMKGEVERQNLPLDYAAKEALYGNKPWFRDQSDRVKAIILTGQNIPNAMRIHLGQGEADETSKDIYDRPVTPGTLVDRYLVEDRVVSTPVTGVTHTITVEDPKSPTGWSQVSLNRLQQEQGRTNATTPAIYAEQVRRTSTGSGQWKQVGDTWQYLPVTTENVSTVQRSPNAAGTPGMGGTPMPVVTPGPAPASVPGPANPSPLAPTPPRSVVRPAAPKVPPLPKGPLKTAAAWKMEMENQYTPDGAKFMRELMPRMEMVKAIKAALEPYKNDDTPASSLLDTLAYRLGYAGDVGGFLSQINLSAIQQAGSAIQGVSKGQQVLGKALIHTPETWRDSKKLMYSKVSEILTNMESMKRAADTYERKYPGLQGKGKAIDNPPPQTPGGPDDLLKKLVDEYKNK